MSTGPSILHVSQKNLGWSHEMIHICPQREIPRVLSKPGCVGEECMFPKYSARWWQKISTPELRDAEEKSASGIISAGDPERISLQVCYVSGPQSSLSPGYERK